MCSSPRAWRLSGVFIGSVAHEGGFVPNRFAVASRCFFPPQVDQEMSYVVEFCFLLMLMLHYLGTSGCCLSSNPGWLLLLQEWNMSRLTGCVKVVRWLFDVAYQNKRSSRPTEKMHWSQQGTDPTSHSIPPISQKVELDLRLKRSFKSRAPGSP